MYRYFFHHLENFDQERVFRFGNLRHWCVKFLPRIFYPFWTSLGQKFRFGLFDRGATGCVKFENFNLERVFRFGTLRSGPERFLQEFLPILGALWRKITIRSFWLACDQNMDRSFWGATKLIKFPNFSPGESTLLRNITPVVPKVFLQKFLHILATLPSKITIRSFLLERDQNLRCHRDIPLQ